MTRIYELRLEVDDDWMHPLTLAFDTHFDRHVATFNVSVIEENPVSPIRFNHSYFVTRKLNTRSEGATSHSLYAILAVGSSMLACLLGVACKCCESKKRVPRNVESRYMINLL
jgi:hypothetical protein